MNFSWKYSVLYFIHIVWAGYGILCSKASTLSLSEASSILEQRASLLPSNKKSEQFHYLSQKYMGAIDAFLESHNQNSGRGVGFLDEDSTDTICMANVYRYLDALQLAAPFAPQKNKLLTACKSFNRDEIASVLKRIYWSIVCCEDYFISTKVKGSSSSYKTCLFLQMQDQSIYNYIRKMAEISAFKEEESPIRKAAALLKGKISDKKDKKCMFEGIFSYGETSEHCTSLLQSNVSYLFKMVNFYEECPLEKWMNSIESRNYNTNSIEIPCAYLDVRVFASTSALFDLEVVNMIAQKMFCVKVGDSEYAKQIKGVKPVINAFISYVRHCIKVYESSVSEIEDPTMVWCKSRLFYIIDTYLKRELTLSILETQLEMILGDLVFSLVKKDLIKKIATIRDIIVMDGLDEIEESAKIGILGEDLSYLTVKKSPFPMPVLIMNAFADRKIAKDGRICLFTNAKIALSQV